MDSGVDSGAGGVEIQVGDSLAFCCGFGGRYEIHTVTRITPSGRIVCGRYTLNPDLSIRGRRSGGIGSWGPRRGEVVTPEIRGIIRSQRVKGKLSGLAQLVGCVDLLEGEEALGRLEWLVDQISAMLDRGKVGDGSR